MSYYDDSAYGRFIADGEAEMNREFELDQRDLAEASAANDGYTDFVEWLRAEGAEYAAYAYGLDYDWCMDQLD